MGRALSISSSLVLILLAAACGGAQRSAAASDFDYKPLANVLGTFVDSKGFVNYQALRSNRADLDRAIREIQQTSPANSPNLFPAREDQLAYWINAYNAWVLRIIVDHYPTSSIAKIGLIPFSAFILTKVELGGEKMTLRSLENDILRARFHDPRVHFAINCASRSCPPLAQEVYRPATLDRQLDNAARAFINNNQDVTLDDAKHRIVLSKIFDWYAADFTQFLDAQGKKPAKATGYLRLYLTPERLRLLDRLSDAKISYHDYDWSLNDQAKERQPE